jgi:hypothetical protein
MNICYIEDKCFGQWSVETGKQPHNKYRCAPVSTGNMFQDQLQLHETVDNMEQYILCYICINKHKYGKV